MSDPIRPLYYILDEHGQPQPCDDLEVWGRWFQNIENRRVSEDRDEGQGTDVHISTVFLGFDHQYGDGPPILWETIVFGGALDGEMQRYSSREDAVIGHQIMCQRVKRVEPEALRTRLEEE